MAKKFNFGFVGQKGLTKVSGYPADGGVNDSVALVIEQALDGECSSLEDIFNSKRFFELGRKICKKHGLDATIVCTTYESDYNPGEPGDSDYDIRYLKHVFCFEIVSLNPDVVRKRPKALNQIAEKLSEDEDTEVEEEEEESLIEKYEIASMFFEIDGWLKGSNVFIEKKHGKYLTHDIYHYTQKIWSSVCSEVVADKIFRAYVDALPLKLRELSKPCCCFGAVGATGICADCHKESEEK